MYFFNRIRFRLKRFIKCGKLKYVGRNVIVNAPQYISIGENFCIGDNCKLQTWPEYRGMKNNKNPRMVIDDNVSFMSNCHVSCSNYIEIGSGCLFGDNVFITDNYHGSNSLEEKNIIPIERKLYSKGSIIIGKNVWIGRNVCVMPNVTIGNGAVIGANSVVTKDIKEYSVAVGAPAKVIKHIDENV